MGKNLEFNWILKLAEEDIDLTGKLVKFEKEGERIYPIEIPILLVDDDWNAYAFVKVLSCLNLRNRTLGKYILEKILYDQEKELLTNLYKRFYDKH